MASYKTHLGKKILIVDDESFIRVLLEETLEEVEDLGVELLMARNGRDGLDMALSEHPDLIFLDIMMPKLSGYDVCREVKASLPDTYVLILSAKGQAVDRDLGVEAGADEYVTKPFDPEYLLGRTIEILEIPEEHLDYGSLELVKSALKVKYERKIAQLQERIKHLEEERQKGSSKGLDKPKDTEPSAPVSFGELGMLISGIVHDLRGGLGAIRNTAGFALEDAQEGTSLATDLHAIIRNTEFCELVIRNLAALGGDDIFAPTWVNIEDVAREIFSMLARKLIDVNFTVTCEGPCRIMADAGHIKQIFMNLIKNAGEAMPDGGDLTIRTQQEGKMLRIEVSDTGRGISKKNQQRLFKELFTTKTKGYGLGLYIVSSLVERHNGTIAVESKWRKGTTFILHFPIRPGDAS